MAQRAKTNDLGAELPVLDDVEAVEAPVVREITQPAVVPADWPDAQDEPRETTQPEVVPADWAHSEALDPAPREITQPEIVTEPWPDAPLDAPLDAQLPRVGAPAELTPAPSALLRESTHPQITAPAAWSGERAPEERPLEITSPSIEVPGLAQRAAAVAAERDQEPSPPVDGDPATDPAANAPPQLVSATSEWNPTPEDERTPAPAPPPSESSGEDTVVLDPEMQDRLMALRAAQDEALRTRYGGEVVVMFSDLVGSTAYYERHGDLMGRQKMLTHNALLFPIIRGYDGTVIKTIGDSIMACFGSPEAALDAAVEMQQALQSYNRGCQDPDEEIHIRVGLNAGPAIAEDGDLHGDAVNTASRLQSAAASGDILLSESLAAAARAKGKDLEGLGELAFKGKAHPTAVYRLRWSDGETHEKSENRVIATRYRLHQEIGRGPVGVVYAAQDLRLRVPVAVKLLHRFILEDEQAANRFELRVQTMASLWHPGIVRVLDSSPRSASDPFYVADRVDGPDLALWVTRNGAPEPRRAVRMVHDLCDAVAFAHRRGVVHGNIKPENVLVGPGNQPLLADFGAGNISRPGQPGTLIASPAYLAPEQAVGGRVDARTDVYGLTALLYFLLTGRPPHKGTASFDALRAVASGLHVPLVKLRPDLPGDLLALCDRGLAAAPEKRHPTVVALGEALDDLLARGVLVAEGEPAEPPRGVEPTPVVKVRVGEKEVAAVAVGDDEAAEPTWVGPRPGAKRAAEPPTADTIETDWSRDPRTLQRALLGVAAVALAAVVALVINLAGSDAAPAPVVSRAGAKGGPEASLVVDAPAGTEVLINGQSMGTLPAVKTMWLTPGVHLLRLQRPGHMPYEERITIGPGQNLRRQVALPPAASAGPGG